jgi:ferritin-like metal-binding protein YciE
MRSSGQDESGTGENPLHELFLDELADIHNAEQQLIKALPRMAKAAQSAELRQAFEQHAGETANQISRLDEVFRSLDESMKRKTCKGMQGLLAEGKEMMEEHGDTEAVDAALIAAAQKVEHYEISSYGTLCAWAKMMGHTNALRLLKENIAEEEATDERLTLLAETVANPHAQQPA